MAIGTRSYAAAQFVLRLDGQDAGFLKSVEGGGAAADVVSETLSGSSLPYAKKHIGALRYEDIMIETDLSMSRAFLDWISGTLVGQFQRKTGSIVTCDYKLEAKSELEFTNALITEITIPALDAAARGSGHLAVKISPEATSIKKGSGKALTQVGSQVGKGRLKPWLVSNFRVEIGGLDSTKVNRVEAITVKQSIANDAVGEMREYTKEPGRLEFPDLKISLAESTAQGWIDWHEDFLIKGNSSETNEKTGSIRLLSQDLGTDLARIDLVGLGIFRIGSPRAESDADAIRRLTAELYCEQLKLTFPLGT